MCLLLLFVAEKRAELKEREVESNSQTTPESPCSRISSIEFNNFYQIDDNVQIIQPPKKRGKL